jgi:hypothetical protein
MKLARGAMDLVGQSPDFLAEICEALGQWA